MQPATYQSSFDQLAPAYDPQTQQINSEIGQLQPQQDAQQASLDQAKLNAFRDITNSANSKGVLFSGVPIDQQAQYVGTKYLPAVANLKATFANNKNSLVSQLNALNAERVKTAQSNVSASQKAIADAQYKQATLALRAQANAISAGKANQPKAATQGQIKQQDMSVTSKNLMSKVGKDGHVSQETWNRAVADWSGAGYSPAEFAKLFIQYVNPRYGGYHGYN